MTSKFEFERNFIFIFRVIPERGIGGCSGASAVRGPTEKRDPQLLHAGIIENKALTRKFTRFNSIGTSIRGSFGREGPLVAAAWSAVAGLAFPALT